MWHIIGIKEFVLEQEDDYYERSTSNETQKQQRCTQGYS